MAFEEVMGAVMGWTTSTEALAAVGAELTLAQTGEKAPPEIADALHAVSTAAGLPDLSDLAPPQRAMVIGLIRLYLHQSLDLLEAPGREPSWTFTDPVILDGWGRGSMMVPMLIAGSHPDLADVESFLDVGTGVGLLAVAAAGVWPRAAIVGVDTWAPSLERAGVNITEAQLGDRITVRDQRAEDVDDVDAYDCIWLPTFFLSEQSLEDAMPSLFRALRRGGWFALGRFRPSPDPLVEATAALRTIRSGGSDMDAKRATEVLEHAGCESVHTVPPPGPMPLELILGQKPS
jgi:SAM-dependent methyltransferase